MTSVSTNDRLEARDARQVPVLADAEVLALTKTLAASFREGASGRDRERVAPRREVEALAGSGVLAVTVPAEYGGGHVSPETVADTLRVLGSADPNIASIAHAHFVNIHLLDVAGTREQKQFFFGEILNGAVLGTAQTDLSNHVSGTALGAGSAETPTRLTRDGPGSFRLNGVKVRATGASLSTWVPTLARLDDGTAEGGEELVAFVPRSAPGLEVVDDSDDIGQRTAARGTATFTDVRVPSEHIMRRGKALIGTHAVGSFAQLLHAAIEVGIAGEALTDAAAFVRTTSRPAHEAHVRRAQDDPLVIQQLGELTVDLRAAEAALGVASRCFTESVLNPSDAAATESAVAVATAKVLGERAALAVTAAIFDVAGTESAARALNLDRHWRNARTHSLDDPVRWKYHHLGRFTLAGVGPPRHRQI
jgi:alkylation response protein AidB-like acyl-CoA dehydrogenase